MQSEAQREESSPARPPPAEGQGGGALFLTGLKLKLFYFLFYGAVGVYVMFFAPYLRGLGFTGDQIGLVTMLSPSVGIAATLAWAVIADRIGAATRALRLCAVVALLPLLYLPFARTPLAVGAVIVLHNLAAPAIVPLIDSVTFEWLRARGAGSYTRTRLFGTLGGLAVVQGLGMVLTSRGERTGDIAMPIALLGIVAAYALLAQTLPPAPPADRPPNARDLRALAGDGRLRLFLLVCVLHWVSFAPYDLLFGVFLRDRGMPSSFMGLGLAGGSIAEALMMFVFPALERRFKVGPLLAMAFAGMAVRWGLLSVSHGALSIAVLQILHGVAAGLFWGAVVRGIGDLVPARLRVTGHALFAAVVVGGGNTIGYRLAGIGYDRLGGAGALFGLAMFLELVPLALVLLLGRRFNPEGRHAAPGEPAPHLIAEQQK
ncbi:MFS transporter [Sorangium sp. So ce1128]